MAIDKSIYYDNLPMPPSPEEIAVEIINPEAVSIETDDGGMIIDFTGGELIDGQALDHYANLAEFMENDDLTKIGSDLVSQFRADKDSREDWEEAYVRGLDLLGLKIEERQEPWEGACGVFHPMLTEAVVRFQSHAIMEIFPASGPARTTIIGDDTPQKRKQSKRIESDLNYFLTERMSEYRNETERLLFNLPLSGSAFKKVWYCERSRRPVSMFVSADDLVASYGASDLQSCPRYTHVMRKTSNEVRRLQLSGFYRDVDLPDPTPEISKSKKKRNDLSGERPSIEHDDRHQLLEMHVDYDLPGSFADDDGIAKPYVITMAKSGEVLSIRRNWFEGDDTFQKRIHFVHYSYMPGLGFYGIGLIHLIGGLTKSATSILRQLVDAGTLSNLPGGFKAKGLRVKGSDTPIMPGEWRDVDVPGDRVRDALLPLPYGEPSTVLYQLLNTVVEEGRRIGSVADINIGSTTGETPVGTTLALMERSMKVMSAVQARLHASLRQELKLLVEVIKDFMPGPYEYSGNEGFTRDEDYDGRVDVLPVSDPNATTMSQRVVQYQAALQLAAQAPHIYNLPLLHRQMLEVLQVKNAEKVVMLEDDYKPMDPIMENMAILKQEPVKAFLYQDHEAHIQAHMAAMQDPKLLEVIGQSPASQAIQASMVSHITEHVAFQYRKEIEAQLGTPLPNPDEPLPQDVEYQLSGLVAQAASRLLQKDQQEAQQQKAKQIEEDPAYQLQRRQQELAERKQAAAEELKKAELALKEFETRESLRLKEMDIHSDERIAGAQMGKEIARENADRGSRERIAGANVGQKTASDILQARRGKGNAEENS